MKRLLLILSLSVLCGCTSDSGYVLLSGPAQGGNYQVKLCAKDASCTVEELKQGVDSILFAIDNSVSGYNPASILSRFNNGEAVAADSIFRELYAISRDVWELTGGAVDVAAGPLFDIWGFGFRSGSMPSDSLVQAVGISCGMSLLPADVDSLLISHTDGTVLNFNCIAQGYSSDLIARYLHSKGIEDYLINVGGEIACSGKNPSGKAWTVGIDRPLDGNMTPGADIDGIYEAENVPCGIVTSGNYRKFYIYDGQKYSHTIDPRSGRPVTHSLLSATVIASDATLADALATYCMVVGLQEASAFVESRPDIEACLIYADGDNMREWTSSGFRLQSVSK